MSIGMATDREALAHYVRELRMRRGLTLRAAAEFAGVSHAYLDAIEKMRPNANITIDTLGTLIRGLGGQMSIVYGHEDELTPSEWGRVALLTRALVASRRDAALSVVVSAALDMIEARLTQLERQGQPAKRET